MKRRLIRQAACAIVSGFLAVPALADPVKPIESNDLIESTAFLDTYRRTSDAQSPAFYDLYSDRAVIHLRTQAEEPAIAIAGRAFKAWGRELLQSGRTALDASVFHEATVEQRGNRLVLRAKRYSMTRCYWDLTYRVGIEREGNVYRIVDERLTSYPAARCKAGPSRSAVQLGSPLAPINLNAPASANVRAPTTAAPPEWHPLSPDELSAKALQLAEQLEARQPATRAVGALTTARALPEHVAPAVARPTDAATNVRITPLESP